MQDPKIRSLTLPFLLIPCAYPVTDALSEHSAEWCFQFIQVSRDEARPQHPNKTGEAAEKHNAMQRNATL